MNLQTLEKTMPKMAEKGDIRITRRYQTTAANCGVAPDMGRKQATESRISPAIEKTERWIYAQDGTRQPITVTCPMFAEWLRVHDRYSGCGKVGE